MVFSNVCLPNREEESLTGAEPRAGLVWPGRAPCSDKEDEGGPIPCSNFVIELNDQIARRKALPLRFSLTKADRILRRREYIALTKTGRRIQNEHFIVYFSADQQGRSRIGVTVTKKVGRAVKRNKIKRLVREFFRLNRHCLTGQWDISIIAKSQAADLSSEKVFGSLQLIADRISSYGNR